MEFEELFELAGNDGTYQIIVFVLLGLVYMYTNLENMAVNFLSPVHPHWCEVPHLAHLPLHEIQELAIPPSKTYESGYENCLRYNVTFNPLTNQTMIDHSSQEHCVDGYMFDHSEFGVTATSEFGIVCEDKLALDFVSPIYTFGFLLGGASAGVISDSFGRRTGLLLYTVLHIAAGIAVTFSVNPWMYIFTRMLIAASVRGTANTGLVMLMESIASKHRVKSVIGYQMFYGLGGMILVGVAYFVRNFRLLQFAITIPLVPMLAYRFLLPESPRWLLTHNRIQESADTLRVIANRNRRTIPEEAYEEYINTYTVRKEHASKNASHKLGLTHLFRHPLVRRYSLICDYILTTSLFIFMGVSMNMSSLFGDAYVNMLVSVSLEFPAYFMLWGVLEKWGRKPSMMVFMFGIVLCSIISFVLEFFEDQDMVITVLSLVSRMFSSCGICGSNLYIGEIFPTSIRQMALGSAATVSALISIAAPLVGGTLVTYWAPLPHVVFGAMALLSIILCWFLPETLGQCLPDTIDDVCHLGKRSNSQLARTSSQSSKGSGLGREKGNIDDIVTPDDSGSSTSNVPYCTKSDFAYDGPEIYTARF